jgi:hypothetical protein
VPEVFGLFVVVAIALVVVGVVVTQRQREATEVAYRQTCLDHGLVPTDAPLGLTDATLSGFDLLPRGDRDCSAVWGMEGPVALTLGPATVTSRVAGFEWWWEDRETRQDGNGATHTTWVRRSVLVAAIRLPDPYVLPRIRVETEGLFARLGVFGRGDFQVESEEFNRRYDVRARDPERAIRLFDAGFQESLLGRFEGSAFELAGDLALVVVPAPRAGPPLSGGARRGGAAGVAAWFDRSGDRIRTDPAIVVALPGVRERAVALLQAMPASWWRAVGGAS